MSVEDLLSNNNYFQDDETDPHSFQKKPGFLDAASVYGSLYVIGFDFGHSDAGPYAPVCKIEADGIKTDADFDQLLEALQQAKATLRQLRHQTASLTKK